jgi:sensor histidine kinase regulating citrate/malate metabolism
MSRIIATASKSFREFIFAIVCFFVVFMVKLCDGFYTCQVSKYFTKCGKSKLFLISIKKVVYNLTTLKSMRIHLF